MMQSICLHIPALLNPSHFLHGLLPCREVCDGPLVSVSTKWVKSWFDQGDVILQGRAISKMTPRPG